LFGGFVGTTSSSDFSEVFIVGLWLMAFPTRPARAIAVGTPEISWFSRRKVPYVLEVYDRAGPHRSSHGGPVRVAFRFA
jgi:hypothetical protein